MIRPWSGSSSAPVKKQSLGLGKGAVLLSWLSHDALFGGVSVTLDSEQKEQWNASLHVSDSHLHPQIPFQWLKKGLSLQVEELKKQSTANSSLLPGISSVTMEASMIMSNIQRIIQVSMASLASSIRSWGSRCSPWWEQMSIHPWVLFLCGQNEHET